MAAAVLEASTSEVIPIPTRNPFIAAKNVHTLCSTANARLVHAIALRVRRGPSAVRCTGGTTFGIFALDIDLLNLHKSRHASQIPKSLCGFRSISDWRDQVRTSTK